MLFVKWCPFCLSLNELTFQQCIHKPELRMSRPHPFPQLIPYDSFIPADKTVISPVYYTRLILGLHLANERRRYKVTPSLIG